MSRTPLVSGIAGAPAGGLVQGDPISVETLVKPCQSTGGAITTAGMGPLVE